MNDYLFGTSPSKVYSTYFGLVPLLFFSIFISSSVLAWDKHQTLMPAILSQTDPEIGQFLSQSVPMPCESDDQEILKSLIPELLLNLKTLVPPTSEKKCVKGIQENISVLKILSGGSIDDPDRGMDQNLPDYDGNPYDPRGDRPHMGGTTGPSSQGFRHMFFGGWKISAPLITFQIPTRAMGQAPDRALAFATKAKELIKQGHIAWGVRLLAWSMHYIQDLSQPFHSVQLVSLKLPEWADLFSWPPGEAFKKLTVDTTRIVSNYHLAFEDYTRTMITEVPSLFQKCLEKPENYTRLKFDPKSENPKDIALLVAKSSKEVASQLGSAEIEFFGIQLKDPSVDIIHQHGDLNYLDYGSRDDLRTQRGTLHQITCEALAHASQGSRALIKWVAQP